MDMKKKISLLLLGSLFFVLIAFPQSKDIYASSDSLEEFDFSTDLVVEPCTMYDWSGKPVKIPAHSQRYMDHPNKQGFSTRNAVGSNTYYSTFKVSYSIGGNKNFKIELMKDGKVVNSRIVKNGKGTVYFKKLDPGWYKIRLTNYNNFQVIANMHVYTQDLNCIGCPK